ncbi:unnamed protein product [Staurois parvus]|uniref:Uncharacterized protein n=1 Tax=Staurois parvus TaxID=386267 RepID=A0ABN9GPM9_9NEOB|nr:unnamed protein product [Staurois parvus]
MVSDTLTPYRNLTHTMIQSPSRHIPCLLLENVPEFPAPLTSPVSSSIIFSVTSRICCMLISSGSAANDLQGEV